MTPLAAAPNIPVRDVLHTDLRPALRASFWATVVLVGVLGVWAALTSISGAVIASGHVVIQGQARPVQNLDGGVVAKLHVRNGDHVQAGQMLLSLNARLLTTNLDIARGRLADALALQARLSSEQRRLSAPVFDYAPLPFAVPDTTRAEAGQRQIFVARAQMLQGQRARLTEAQAQFTHQLAGSTGQITAKRDEIALIETEIANQQALVDKGLVRQAQLMDLLRAHAAALGELAALEADHARLQNALRDRELETLQGERSFQEQVVTDLREVTTQVEELTLDILTRSDQLARVDIRAPITGIVHEMQVFDTGEVVAPGATILSLVPSGGALEFDLRVDPRAIDQVVPGQQAEVAISSFDPQSVPRLKATVSTISPDAVTDPGTGRSFYRVTLSVAPKELDRLGTAEPIPGMPVEAYLATTDRTVLTYLVSPLAHHLIRAFREN